MRKDASLSVLARISKLWSTSGQQEVRVKTLIVEAMKTNYTNSEIALEIRRFSFRSKRFDEKNRSKDPYYRKITKRLRVYRKEYEEGKMNHIFELTGKVAHRCMNCDAPMHGALCGSLWAERGPNCMVSYESLTNEGQRQTKSIGALICAMCMKG